MSIIASWKGKKFEISNKKITSINSISTGVRLSEEKGREPQVIPVDYYVSVSIGVEPREEYNSWLKLLGKIDTFKLGGSRFGPSKMQLTAVDINDITLNHLGRIMSAMISLAFTEYAPDSGGGSGTPENTPPASYDDKPGGNETAADVGSSGTDKATKRPKNIQMDK